MWSDVSAVSWEVLNDNDVRITDNKAKSTITVTSNDMIFILSPITYTVNTTHVCLPCCIHPSFLNTCRPIINGLHITVKEVHCIYKTENLSFLTTLVRHITETEIRSRAKWDSINLSYTTSFTQQISRKAILLLRQNKATLYDAHDLLCI
jgi:hypothetical protein